MTHTEAFEKFRERRARERAETVRVTWRKVSPMTGGGYSGLGPNGQLVYVTDRCIFGGKDGNYSYGRRDADGTPQAVGWAPTVAAAKRAAADLLNGHDSVATGDNSTGRETR